MSIANWILGTKPAAQCAWCRKPIGIVGHAPIPVCQRCFASAYANSRRGDWARLMQEFEPQAKKWVRGMQTRPTHVDIVGGQMTATQDVLALYATSKALTAAGKTTEAAEAQDRARALEGQIREVGRGAIQLIADMDGGQ